MIIKSASKKNSGTNNQEELKYKHPKYPDEIKFAYPPYLMFESSEDFSRGHEPTLRRMPDGSLCSTLITGKNVFDDRLKENSVGIIHSYDDGATWTPPRELFNHPARATWATEIFTEGEKPLLFFCCHNEETMFTELRTFMAGSTDSGKNWTEPHSINGVPHNMVVRQGRILSDGSWLFPVYWTSQQGGWDAFWPMPGEPMPGMLKWTSCSGVLKTSDGAKTFSLHGAIYREDGGASWEPEVTELEDGHLLMFIRSDIEDKALWKSESFDYGLSWTAMEKTNISNPSTKAVIYRIKNNYVMFNNIYPEKVFKNGRQRLEMWVSNDRCASFARKTVISQVNTPVYSDQKIKSVCYPHGFADDDKNIFYLSLSCGDALFMLKIPYKDILLQ